MRFISGFGGFILHTDDDDLLKIKFKNCLEQCLSVYQTLLETGKIKNNWEVLTTTIQKEIKEGAKISSIVANDRKILPIKIDQEGYKISVSDDKELI